MKNPCTRLTALALCVYALPVDAGQQVSLANNGVLSGVITDYQFKAASANKEGVDVKARAYMFEGEHYFDDHVSLGAGIGLLDYNDLNEFSQATSDSNGDNVGVSTSTAGAVPVYFKAGYTVISTGNVPAYGALHAGYLHMASSERAIDNCVDCYSQSINLRGGVFVSATAGINITDNWSVSVYHEQFLTGDISQANGLRITFGKMRSEVASSFETSPLPPMDSLPAPTAFPPADSLPPDSGISPPAPAPAQPAIINAPEQRSNSEDRGRQWSPVDLEM